MLHAISLQLATALQARGCPVPVVYGPERPSDAALNKPRIVLQYDREKGDSHSGPRSQTVNPRQVFTRTKGCVCRIFAQSTLEGAGVWNHERDADQIADHVQICLASILPRRNTLWLPTGGKFLNKQELQMLDLEAWPGVVYEFAFQFDRGVLDVTWRTPTQSAGSAQEEHTMGSDELSTSVRVRKDGGAWEPAT